VKNEGEKILPRFVWKNLHYAPLCTAFGSGRTGLRLLPTALNKRGPCKYRPALCRL